MILQWCWAHQRRSFIDCAAGRVRLRRWCQRWIERIAEIYRLNDARLKHYDRAHPLERQSPAFDVAHAKLKKAVDELFAAAEAELAGLTDRTRRAKPLRSLVKHREGLCVFVDKPFVPMDNNRGELALRSAVIGRRLSFGSDSEKGAGFTATMYSVAGTLAIGNPMTICPMSVARNLMAARVRPGTAVGRGLKDMMARVTMLAMHRDGLIELPPPRWQRGRLKPIVFGPGRR